jgi:type IV secretory pathway VirB6-like protein
MKIEFKARAVSFIASLTFALVATLGVAVSMTSSGNHTWLEASTQSSKTVAKSEATSAGKSNTKSAAKFAAQVMSAWAAPVARPSRQVL